MQNKEWNFLNTLVAKIGGDEVNQEALLYIRSSVVLLSLSLGEEALEESKKLLDAVEDSLKAFLIRTLDSSIYSNFYLAEARYYKLKGQSSDFYKNAMLFLSYTPIEKIPIDAQRSIAFDLGINALVGEDIYNFGDLLSHPILASLRDTTKDWLEQILRAFNAGDIELYEKLVHHNMNNIQNEHVLFRALELLKQKISILCLMQLVLDRSGSDRIFSFEDIGKKTKLHVDSVELLVMRALSLKLIKGYINQVNQTVVISWVQPRVLDLESIAKMRDRLEEWRTKVQATLIFVEQQTGEIV